MTAKSETQTLPSPADANETGRIASFANRLSNRRLLGGIAAAVALALLMPASPAVAGEITGVSDQVMEQWTENDKTKVDQLKLSDSRLVVSWDVATNPSKAAEKAKVEQWLANSAQRHLDPMISFGWPDPNNVSNLPSTKTAYRQAVAAFVAAHPQVRRYTAFNEANRFGSRIPPSRAANYDQALRSVVNRGTIVAAADFNTPTTVPKYIKKYRQELQKRGITPAVWAMHAYEGKVSIKQVRKLLPADARLWITEAKLTYGPQQVSQARHLRCTAAEKTYIYQVRDTHPALEWDSAFLHNDGTPRPVFQYLVNSAHGQKTPKVRAC